MPLSPSSRSRSVPTTAGTTDHHFHDYVLMTLVLLSGLVSVGEADEAALLQQREQQQRGDAGESGRLDGSLGDLRVLCGPQGP